MALKQLQLSLQFGDIPYAVRHRAALPRHAVTRAIRHALVDDAEITVRIVGEDEGRELNQSYRKKDYATNVLTFDYAQEPVVLADLVLCAPVVAREAKEQGKTLAAHYAPRTPLKFAFGLLVLYSASGQDLATVLRQAARMGLINDGLV